MALIKGKNGRMYNTATGQRIDAVEHPELRSRDELIAARIAQQPAQPKRFDGNPFEKTIELELKRHNHNWAHSDEGKRVLGNLRRASKEWEADQKAKREQAEFNESVKPLREHAEQQTQAVFDSADYSQQEVEEAEAACAAAAAGNRSAYAAWERQHHEKLLAKLATEAADADGIARQAAQRRDAILKSGINYAPQPIPEIRQPEPTIPVDRSKVAVTRRVPVDGGFREVTDIVDAE